MNSSDSNLTVSLSLSPEQTEKLYAMIAEIDAVRYVFLRGNHLAPQTFQRLSIDALIASAAASSRLENKPLSDADARAVYRNLNVIRKFKTRDVQEAAGYLETLQKIFAHHSDSVLDETAILQLHKDFLSHSDHDKERIGCFRTGSFSNDYNLPGGASIGLTFHAPPITETQTAIGNAVTGYQSACAENYKHPLILIAAFIFEFTMIMPFWVGGTRMARLLTNLLLLQHGYGFAAITSHECILERHKDKYNHVLDQAFEAWKREEYKASEWLMFVVGVFLEQAREAQQFMEGDQFEFLLSEKQLALWSWAQQEREFSRADAIAALGYPARTAEASILKLTNLGKLRRLGEGRATRYRVAA